VPAAVLVLAPVTAAIAVTVATAVPYHLEYQSWYYWLGVLLAVSAVVAEAAVAAAVVVEAVAVVAAVAIAGDPLVVAFAAVEGAAAAYVA